jgi:hypothetical protein
MHAVAVSESLEALQADAVSGLTDAEAARRLESYGPNRLPAPKGRHPALRFLTHFHNLLIYVLMGAFWGSTSVFIPQFSNSALQLFTMLLLVTASAGCVPGYSLALRPTWLVLTLTLLPSAPAFLISNNDLGLQIGAGAIAVHVGVVVRRTTDAGVIVVAVLGRGLCRQKRLTGDHFAEPHDVRPKQPTATEAARQPAACIAGSLGDDLLDGAAVTQDVAVVLDHAGASGPLVQPVHVLRDQRQAGNPVDECGERVVTCVGQGVADELTPPLVPPPDEFRVALETFGRGEVERVIAGPETFLGIAKSRYAALRGDSRARQDADMPRPGNGRGGGPDQLG